MWYLTSNKTSENFYLLCDKSKFSIGRLDTDLILGNDDSISRVHAFLYIIENSNVLQLEDAGSKYGVYLNNGIEAKKPLKKNSNNNIKNGDRIRFGVFQNVWIVKKLDIITTTSALSDNEMEKLNDYMKSLNGNIAKQWNENCTHLTMSEISVTIKVLYALLAQVPIVTCDFWKAMINGIQRKNNNLPLPEKFIPQRCHLPIKLKRNELYKRPERLSLFKGFTFVFMCARHYDLYGPIVKIAGANVKALNDGVRKSFLLNKNVVVIQYIPSTQSQSSEVFMKIEVLLEENSRRVIPEFEIGLAIIYCSTEKYCNPMFKMNENLMPITLSVGFNTEEIKNTIELEETQPNTSSMPITDIIIEDSDCSSSSSLKAAVIQDKEESILDVNNKRKHSVLEDVTTNDEEQSISKRSKRTTIRKLSSSDSDNDNLFNFKDNVKDSTSKQTIEPDFDIENEMPTTSKAAMARITRYSLRSHANNNATNDHNNSELVEKEKPTIIVENVIEVKTIRNNKRPRVAILCDTDDSDDEDLFNFDDDNSSKKLKKNAFNDESNSLFNFNDDEIDVDVGHTHVEEEHKIITNRKSNKIEMPKPKLLPAKVDTSNWLSCASIPKEEIDKSIIKTESLTNEEKWSEGLIGKFNVRIRDMILNDVTQHNGSLLNTLEHYDNTKSNVKNFKTFKRKLNIKRQTRIVETIRMPIIYDRSK